MTPYRVIWCEEAQYQNLDYWVNYPTNSCDIDLISVALDIDRGPVEEPGADVLLLTLPYGGDALHSDDGADEYPKLSGLRLRWRDYEWDVEDSHWINSQQGVRRLFLRYRSHLG
jgi:hypothetical protein